MLRKIKKFIDDNIVIIILANWILVFIIIMIATVLASLGIISIRKYKMTPIVAAAPMYFIFLLDVILMIFLKE